MFVIAHELGHVVDEGAIYDSAASELGEGAAESEVLDKIISRKRQEPIEVLEQRVDDLVATWGGSSPAEWHLSPEGLVFRAD